jgi:hypothetical protein
MKPNSCYVPKKKIELSRAEVAGDKKWSKLFQKSDALQSLFVQIVEDETAQPRAGAAVQRAIDRHPLTRNHPYFILVEKPAGQ